MSEWMILKVSPGAPETKAQLCVLPPGPYILVPQHSREHFLKTYLTHWHKGEHDFRLQYGYETYAIDIKTGEPILVGYWTDSSD